MIENIQIINTYKQSIICIYQECRLKMSEFEL